MEQHQAYKKGDLPFKSTHGDSSSPRSSPQPEKWWILCRGSPEENGPFVTEFGNEVILHL